MQCPHCGEHNLVGARFCKKCGQALPAPPAAPSPAPPAPPPTPAPRPPPGSPVGPPISLAPQPIPQMGPTAFSPFSIWGPFAGYGTRGRHVAWLLNDLGNRADLLRETISRRFAARAIPDARVADKVLVARGVVVERRPYFLIRRGIATAGLYIAHLGEDLYISQVTYARNPLSLARALVLLLMLAFQGFFLLGGFENLLASLIPNVDPLDWLLGSGGSAGVDFGLLALFLCCVGPLGLVNTLALILAGIFTVWRTVTDRDPLAILRTTPNEFRQDDVIALEKAVEETVRECMDQVGIDRQLLPPAAQYGVRQRLI